MRNRCADNPRKISAGMSIDTVSKVNHAIGADFSIKGERVVAALDGLKATVGTFFSRAVASCCTR